MQLKPYAKMRPSGVQWLGGVPAHWDVRRLKYILQDRDARSKDGQESLLRVSQYSGVTLRRAQDSSNGPGSRSESLVGYKEVAPHDLVVNIMLAWNGSMGVSRFHGVASPAYCVYRFKTDAHPWYFHYLLRSAAYKARIKILSTGVVESRLRLYTDDLYRLEALVPPRTEQDTIVRFLDRFDLTFRRHIAARQAALELLEEQRIATINHLLSRGLDSRARLKFSRVEWLGEIPAHWEVIRLGRLISLTTGFPFPSEGFTQVNGAIRLLRGVNVSPGRVRWDETVYWPSGQRENFRDFELLPGDIVLGMDRPVIRGGVRVAVIHASDTPALLVQRVARIRPRQDLLPAFAALVLSGPSFSQYIAPIFTGISVPHLSPEQIKSFAFALPGTAEQHAIVEQVAVDTRATNAALEGIRREIAALHEYRVRLVEDVVTGRVNVCDIAVGESNNDHISAVLDEVIDADDVDRDIDDNASLAENEL